VVVDTDKYDQLVAHIAYEFSRKFHMVDADDVRQELWIWFLEHPNKVKTWEALDGKQSIKLIARSLRNAAKDYCQKQKAQAVGYRVEDNYYYDRELIEALLPKKTRWWNSFCVIVSRRCTTIGSSGKKFHLITNEVGEPQ
jgi:DNA-directed RNA polymerase specialized sigma24 family protein